MRFFLAFLLIPVLAYAQQARTISCRFLGFQTTEETKSLTCVSEKNEVLCPFDTSNLSSPVNLVAVDGVLTFIDSDQRKPALSVTVPATVRQALIVIMPNLKGAATPWRGFVIEDSAKHFPNGGALVVNLHSTQIRYVIGEHRYLLKPGNQYGVEMPKQRDDFNMSTVVFEFFHNDQWIKASESRLRFTEGLRYLTLAYTDPTSLRPRLTTFQDEPFKAAEKVK